MTAPRIGVVHAAAFFVGLTLVATLTTNPDDRRFYRELKRPGFAPPPWVFPAAWTGLNLLQVWADMRLINGRDIEGRSTLLGLRGFNWLLYGLFNPAFFRARSPVLGEAVTVAQALNTFATILAARRSAPGVAAALTPLAAWLTFASTLAGWMAVKNPDPVFGPLADRARGRFTAPVPATIH
jgi:tryptophan-rich sensory protein